MATKQKTSSDLLDEVIRAAKGIRTSQDQERFQTLANEYRKQFDKEYSEWQQRHQEDLKQHQTDMKRIRERNQELIKRLRERQLAPIIPLWL